MIIYKRNKYAMVIIKWGVERKSQKWLKTRLLSLLELATGTKWVKISKRIILSIVQSGLQLNIKN